MNGVAPTLYSCHRAVVAYRRQRASRRSAEPPPRVSLAAIDAFLLQLLASYLPAPPTVVDLAGAATQGESTVLWLSATGVGRLIAPADEETGVSAHGWRDDVRHLLASLQIEETTRYTGVPITVPGGWEEIDQHLDPRSPLMFMVTPADDRTSALGERLAWLLSKRADAMILLLPLGAIGSSRTLIEALGFCADNPAYRLTALREVGPYFAQSQLGLIHATESREVGAALVRLRQLVDGNFNFMTLVEDAAEAARREGRARAEIRDLRTLSAVRALALAVLGFLQRCGRRLLGR